MQGVLGAGAWVYVPHFENEAWYPLYKHVCAIYSYHLVFVVRDILYVVEANYPIFKYTSPPSFPMAYLVIIFGPFVLTIFFSL